MGSFTYFFGSFLGLCLLIPCSLFFSVCFSSSFLAFFSSSTVCCILLCGFSWGCARWFFVLYGVLPPPLYLALLMVAYCAFSIRLGVLLMVSHDFPCGFLSYFCTSYLSYITVLLVCFVPYVSAWVVASVVWFTHFSPFVFLHHHRCYANAVV